MEGVHQIGLRVNSKGDEAIFPCQSGVHLDAQCLPEACSYASEGNANLLAQVELHFAVPCNESV